MPFDQRGLNDYVDVAQRIADFRERYPDGCLQPWNPAAPFDVRELTGTGKDGKPFTVTLIVYTAAAYRTPDDPKPGIGCAWEPFPGRTPYTLGSELMNAETSAWGRAIVAVLASDSKRGVASREEVRNRNAEQEPEPPQQRGKPAVRTAAELPRNRDGSVSRSRATSEELEAAGAMSDTQIREHNALEREVLGTGADGKVRQHQPRAEDPGDLFNTVPADGADSVAERLNGEGERLATPEQAKTVVAAFRALGMAERAEIMEAMELLINRDFLHALHADLSDLTEDEATHLLDELAGVEDLEGLTGLLEAQKEAV